MVSALKDVNKDLRLQLHMVHTYAYYGFQLVFFFVYTLFVLKLKEQEEIKERIIRAGKMCTDT